MATTKASPESMAKIRKAVDEFNARIEVESQTAHRLFGGLKKQSPPTSQELTAFYKELGNGVLKIKNRDGHLIEHPTVAQVENYCKRHNILFHDWQFKPSENSIYRLRNRADEKPANQRMPIIWKRPHEFFTSEKEGESVEIVLFDSISPDDIKQGMLGDCWLMCR